MLIQAAYGLSFASAAVVGGVLYAPLARRLVAAIERQIMEFSNRLSDSFINLNSRQLWALLLGSPLALGLLGWLALEHWVGGLGGLAAGLFVPRLVVAQMLRARRQRFQAQLVDGLLLLSSSLKAGLSMLQSFGVVVEEMPPPISQEFGLVLKETRMGVGMEEAMAHLKARMPSDGASLFVTAVLVSRETGGDVTQVFARLVETMRERRKLKEKIQTLTFMARLQGLLMAMLPVVFAFIVYNMNREYFQFFLTNSLGHVLLMIVIALQVIGFVLFLRFSRSPV